MKILNTTKLLAATTSLIIFASSNSYAQSTQAVGSFVMHRTYAAAATAAADKLVNIEPIDKGTEYVGYSALMLSVGAASKAAEEQAITQAKKSSITDFLMAQSFEHNFINGASPPGSFLSGRHWVFTLKPIRYVEATPANLLTEIKAHLRSMGSYNDSTIKNFDALKSEYRNGRNLLTREHLTHLLELAKKPMYAELVPEYKAIIRSTNFPNAPFALTALVKLIQDHDGKNSVDDFRRWAQYHEYAKLRATALSAMIALGERAQAEAILKSEKSTWVRAVIERELL